MKGRNYRTAKSAPYVRKEYIHGAPVPKITKFEMGNLGAEYQHKLLLIAQKRVQVRHNSLEAVRVAVNKVLFDALGESGYGLKMRVYPHIVLRENKMMAFAGADRLQEGMRRSFGKPVGLAALVKPGQPLVEINVNSNGLEAAKKALVRGARKLPTPCSIEIINNTQAA